MVQSGAVSLSPRPSIGSLLLYRNNTADNYWIRVIRRRYVNGHRHHLMICLNESVWCRADSVDRGRHTVPKLECCHGDYRAADAISISYPWVRIEIRDRQPIYVVGSSIDRR